MTANEWPNGLASPIGSPRRHRRALFLATVLVATLIPGRATSQRTLTELLEQQASVAVPDEVSPGTLVRLPLTAEVLATVRGDLSDIRLLSEAGVEVPYLVDAGAARRVQVSERLVARIVSVDRNLTSPEEDLPIATEIYELALPPRSTTDLRGQRIWDLVFTIPQTAWVASVDLTLIGPGDDRVDLLQGASLFRLDSPRATRDRLPIGQIESASPEQIAQVQTDPDPPERLRVTMHSRRSDYLEPAFSFEQVSVATYDPGGLRVPLEMTELAADRGQTRATLARAPGLVPDAIEVTTSTPTFGRHVSVRDGGALGADRVLGTGRLVRLGQPGSPVQGLTVELTSRPRGRQLELLIEDGDSPALADLEVSAILRQPSLIFPAPTGTVQLLFGGDRVGAPSYDLEALRASLGLEWGARTLDDIELQLTEALAAAVLPVASLGGAETNPGYDERPALSFAMRAGAEIDPRSFTHRRSVVIPETRDGLVSLSLEPGDTTLAQSSLDDIRIVDEQARQWPFVIHRPTRPQRRPLAVRQEGSAGATLYVLALGSEEQLELSATLLELDIEEPFFDRSYELECWRQGDDSTRVRRLGSGRLTRDARDRLAALRVAVAADRCVELRLNVEDGDDAPLTLLGAWAHLELPELLIAAPAGDYQFLVGDPEIDAPSFELRRASDLVLAVNSVPAEVGALEPNPGYTSRSRLSRPQNLERIGVYAVVGAATLILGFITWRTLRNVEPPSGA